MKRRLSALLVLAAPILVGASALQAQQAGNAPACFPARYAELRKIPEESRTFEQQQEFEQLKSACAEAGAAAVAGQRASPAPAAPQQRRLAPAPAMPSPEEARLRHGFWFTGGLGGGSLGCKDCSDRSTGVAVNIALGGTVSQHVQLGGGIYGWSKTENDVTLTASTAMAVIRVYPTHRSRFFFLGGVGGGQMSAQVNTWSGDSEAAGAAVVGVGYDIRLSRTVSLSPFFNSVGMAGNEWDANFGQLGLAITTY